MLFLDENFLLFSNKIAGILGQPPVSTYQRPALQIFYNAGTGQDCNPPAIRNNQVSHAEVLLPQPQKTEFPIRCYSDQGQK